MRFQGGYECVAAVGRPIDWCHARRNSFVAPTAA
jgi:hypothetical protein